MNILPLMDLLSLLASAAGLLIFWAAWKRGAFEDSGWLIAGILFLSTFLGLSNFLEWSGITNKLDPFEDYIEILRPFLWLFFVYAFIEEDAKRKRVNMISELELKNKELDLFLRTISHDIKSPLISIKGLLILLKKDITEENTKQLENRIDHIFRITDKMSLLLNKLLSVSRLGGSCLSPEKVPLKKLFDEACELVNIQSPEKKICVEISSELPTICVDRLLFIQVLQNLLDNAIKYMGDQPEPRIKIGVRKNGEKTVCYVQDNGMGIDPAHGEKIFDLFAKLNPNIEGSGVGLALVRRIIEAHGHKVWVESEGPKKGSTFLFSLPVAE